MKRTIFLMCTVLLASCGTPAFVITESDDRFSESKNPFFMSENNRLSTLSIAGGRHIDDSGVFFNPFVEKDEVTGEIIMLGLRVFNRTDYDTLFGSINQFGLIETVVFRFADDSLVTKIPGESDVQYSDLASYNSLLGMASVDKWETATILLSIDEYQRIATAGDLSVKITGSKNNKIYESKDIAESFQQNLSAFYEQFLR